MNKKRQYETNQCRNSSEQHVLSENYILEMFENLDTINDLANKTSETFSKDDQLQLKTVHNNLHKLLTMMVFTYSAIEKTNEMLKNQLIVNDLIMSYRCNDQKGKGDIEAGENTYANVLTKSLSENHKNVHNNVTHSTENNEPWRTPIAAKRHETIVHIENVKDPEEALKQFKIELSDSNTCKGFKSVKQTRRGAIIIESFDKDQQNKLKVAMQGKEHLKIKESQNTDPMFMITGVQKGFTNEEFLEEIERLNEEIVQELGYSVRDKIQVITKKQCRNPTKENWILQAAPPISKWFLKRGKIFFDLVIVYVQEHYNLAQCFKCCSFGHVSKFCSEKQCCHKCGKEHSATDCSEAVLRCPNCIRLKLNNLNHSARDKSCPAYERRLNAFKKTSIIMIFYKTNEWGQEAWQKTIIGEQ